MEGPSIVLLTDELKPFFKKKVDELSGTMAEKFPDLQGATFKKARSWGKHLLLIFDNTTLRVHFLMFGSYRINDSRDREPKLRLRFGTDRVELYSCAVKTLTASELKVYDWSIDLMSDEWDEKSVVKLFRKKPEAMVCDVLMDQAVFPGLGNIIKNEILFELGVHPELKIDDLTPKMQLALVREARDYSLQFYEWKKANVLKKNWKIFRKRKCRVCKSDLAIGKTGKLLRVSYWCERCQPSNPKKKKAARA
jgi:endonuclease-8